MTHDLTRRSVAALMTKGVAALALTGAMAATHAQAADGKARHESLIASASACLTAAEICHAHCLRLLGSGDTSLKICAPLVSATLPVCGALIRLATLEHARLKEFAAACINVCADCEAECRKHESHHAECKRCADACADCIKACKALIAA